MKKILIIKHGSLGDIVFSLAAMISIRNQYPDSAIHLLTEKKNSNFLSKSKIFDKIIIDERKNFFIKSLLIIYKLLSIRYNLIIDLQNSQRTSFYNFFFRIFHSAKISSSRNFAHFRYKIPQQGKENVTVGLFNQLGLLNIKKSSYIDYSWLKVKLEEEFKKPLAIFIPGVSKNGSHKQWPESNFAKLAKYCEEKNFDICVIGAKNDYNSALPILNICKNVINKIDKSPPEIIYSLALKSSIIFTNDTGPGHIAALANKNIVIIANDNNISKANLPNGKHVKKVLANSVKNILPEDLFQFINKV